MKWAEKKNSNIVMKISYLNSQKMYVGTHDPLVSDLKKKLNL